MSTTTEKKYPGTVKWSGKAWTSANNVVGNTTYYSIIQDTQQRYAAFSGFDLSSVPSDATILGYDITINMAPSSTSLTCYLNYDLITNIPSSYDESCEKIGSMITLADGKISSSARVDYSHSSTTDSVVSWMNSHVSDLRSGNFGVLVNGSRVKVYTIAVQITYATQVTITTSVSPSGSGTVTGGGTYAAGASVTLTATPSTGYHFVQWNDGNTNASRSVTASADATYTATFAINSYNVSATVSPSGSGSVSGTGSYNYGATATLTATAASGYRFVRWSDNVTAATRSFTVTSAVSYTAYFEVSSVTVSFDACGGSVSTASKSVTPGGAYGTLPTPTRTGYTFTGWYTVQPVYNGGFLRNNTCIAISRSYMYTDKIAVHIDAYEKNWNDINGKQLISCTEGGGWGIGYLANTTGHGTEIYIDGVGYKGVDFGIASLSSGWHAFDMVFDGGTFYGYVDGTLKGSVATGGTSIKYHDSNAIFIGAEAGSSASTGGGAYFNGSLGSVIIGNVNSRLTTITSSSTVSAVTSHTLYAGWRINHYTTTASGANGTVNSVSSYSSENPYNEQIVLAAAPNTGYEFVKWNDNNTSASRTITVTGSVAYTATFQLKTYTIYFRDEDGNSLGSVTAQHGSSPQVSSTPTKSPSGGYVYTFREWNTQQDGSGTAYPLNGLPAATSSTTYFAQYDATYSEPDIASVTVAPNPANSGQGIVITVTFTT